MILIILLMPPNPPSADPGPTVGETAFLVCRGAAFERQYPPPKVAAPSEPTEPLQDGSAKRLLLERTGLPAVVAGGHTEGPAQGKGPR